jgi:hypothetical protein
MVRKIFFLIVISMGLLKPVFADTALSPIQQQFHQLKMQIYAANKKGDKKKIEEIKAQLEVLRGQMR